VAADRTEFDVAIIGGGPAGSAAALALSRHTNRRAVLIERSDYGAIRVGENVSSGIAPILAYLGVGNLVGEEEHLAAFANLAAWGSARASRRELLFTPGGHGWLLDRAVFDAALASAAQRAGIQVLRGTNVIAAEFAGNTWEITIRGQSSFGLIAKQIIDATGRRCVMARAAGARRDIADNLVGLVTWMRFAAPGDQQKTVLIEAVENGWWYSAPVPGERLVLAYMTDGDQLSRGLIGDTETFLRFVSAAPLTLARIADGTPVVPPRVWLAESAITRPSFGDGWIAAGDAAASFDPLSSLGIGYAMLSGIQTARAVDHRLAGDEELASAYAVDIERHVRAYRIQRRELYRLEQRWADRPFWLRRHVACEHIPSAAGALASAEGSQQAGTIS
jgi:flavin-dependent dehydrogenase